ncbi:hypothetical protein [Dyadobacter luticola]|uniref:Uncharacterized protein n=1 Tax=Dyadobacter luticola TaxID=1979387 RepID=A0A5R9L3K5_9BACT|nr:hypothetical protein [Dyadobacter luticola]TLV02875.1 hypothetical protein FEN17_04485 [Dyadobacter luticola]
MFGGTSVSNLSRLTGFQYYHTVPHIVFNGGDYSAIHFSRFKSEYIKGAETSGETANLPNEALLNIEIRVGRFKGPIRFTNSRIGNVKILGGIFEEVVAFERGIYGNIEISGGEFKNGIFLGNNNLFPNEVPFLPPPGGVKTWTSTVSGIFENLRLTSKSEIEIVLSNIVVKNTFLVDIKQGDVDIHGLLSLVRSQYCGGKISESYGNHSILEIGNTRNVSKLQLSVVNTNTNELTFLGLLSRESGISFNVCKVTSLTFNSFVSLGSVKFDRLSFINFKKDFFSIDLVPRAQALNSSEYYNSAFHTSSNPEIWPQVLASYEPGLREVPAAKQIHANSIFTIKNSDLGKMIFLQCDFSSEVSFENSKLNEIALIGNDFPINRWAENTNTSQQRLLLFQLKKVYEASGDNDRARRHRAAELEAYRQDLSRSDRGERFTLGLNQWSNSHGESWTKALGRILFYGVLSWLTVSLPFFEIEVDPAENFRVFVLSLSYFIEYLNPIHKLGFVKDFAENVARVKIENKVEYALAWGNVIDSLWRILSAYLIYQLIFAFRKHSK